MRKIPVFLYALFCLLVLSCNGVAAGIPVYVNEFSINGAPERANMKSTLQMLLASRLNGDAVAVAAGQASADIVVDCSYTQLGKVFSLDAVARERAGKVVARAFEQGTGEDDLIPALGRLAQKLRTDLVGLTSAPSGNITDAKSKSLATAVIPVEQQPPAATQSADVIRVEPAAKGGMNASPRLTGAFVGVASGRALAQGARELYILGEHSLSLYHQGADLKLVAEANFDKNEKPLAIDTADLDGDGVPEVYVTLVRGNALASQVWVEKDGHLQRDARDLPYYFRTLALMGGAKKLYVQQMGTDAEFYGDVHELFKNGETYGMRNPLKLPRFANIYNFNQFTDAAGKRLTVVIHPDGYLLVYSDSGEELWRSSDKFGGSEVYLNPQDLANARSKGEQYGWIFLEQRLFVTPQNEIIVPRNLGFFVFGNNRSYKKNTVFAFAWNGSTLEERWHTRESQNYLADFDYDAARKELILLEVVKKKGLLEKGASTVVVKKVE
jgi:hypothetical protein